MIKYLLKLLIFIRSSPGSGADNKLPQQMGDAQGYVAELLRRLVLLRERARHPQLLERLRAHIRCAGARAQVRHRVVRPPLLDGPHRQPQRLHRLPVRARARLQALPLRLPLRLPQQRRGRCCHASRVLLRQLRGDHR